MVAFARLALLAMIFWFLETGSGLVSSDLCYTLRHS